MTLSLGLFFAFLLAVVRPFLDKILDRDDPNNALHIYFFPSFPPTFFFFVLSVPVLIYAGRKLSYILG